MDLNGEYLVPAPRQQVWEMLNDPEILGQCIPGCKSIAKNEDGGFDAIVELKIGPVKAKFSGQVGFSDIVEAQSYRISGEGKGGVAGFAKGGADVALSDSDDGTRLVYKADAQIGGKIAQLGNRLIQSTAAKLADQFFSKFSELVSQSPAA